MTNTSGRQSGINLAIQ